MKKETYELVKIDPRFQPLVDEFGYPTFKKEQHYFKALVRSIIYQQLSGKAASKIHSRFLAIYNEKIHPLPSQIKSNSLRTGDTVEGEMRAPRDYERYFAISKIDKINF